LRSAARPRRLFKSEVAEIRAPAVNVAVTKPSIAIALPTMPAGLGTSWARQGRFQVTVVTIGGESGTSL
jgi:hypothetical protein